MELTDLSHSRAAKLIRHLALAAKRQESKRAAKLEVKQGIDSIKEVLERPVEKQKLNAAIERLESTMMHLIDQEKQIFSNQGNFNSKFEQHLSYEKQHSEEEQMLKKALGLKIERDEKEIQLLDRELKLLEIKYKQLEKKYPKRMLKGIESKIKSSRQKLRKLKNKKKR